MGEMKKYKTTIKHFKVFIAECEKWVDLFQLRSWEVRYKHQDSDIDKNWNAWCMTSWCDRTAHLGLAKNWGPIKPTKREVRISAFHEVCELLLSRLIIEAKVDRCPTELDSIKEQTHTIIRRLEHAIWTSNPYE